MEYNPKDTTTIRALKEAIGYFERHDRTEETLEIRRLLRAALAEQIEKRPPLADLVDRQMPQKIARYTTLNSDPIHIKDDA